MARRLLVTAVLDTGEPPALMIRHVSRCLRCQASVAQTRRLRRELAGLPPPEVEAEDGGAYGKGWVAVGVASVAVAAVVARSRQTSD